MRRKTLYKLSMSLTVFCYFVLDLCSTQWLRGLCLKLKLFFWNKKIYVQELGLNNVSFKVKFHMSIWQGTNVTKWKINGSVLIFQELLNMEYFQARFNHATETLQNLKLQKCLKNLKVSYKTGSFIISLKLHRTFQTTVSVLRRIVLNSFYKYKYTLHNQN